MRGYTASTTRRPLQTITATVNMVSRTYNEPAYQTTQPNSRFRTASLSKAGDRARHPATGSDGKLAMSDSAYAILREDASTTAFAGAPADANMLNVTVKLVNHEGGFARGAPLSTPQGSHGTSSTTPIRRAP